MGLLRANRQHLFCSSSAMNLFAFIPTILSTPLLKIPLLVSEAILNHIATTPPNPPPPPVQKKKYDGHDILTTIYDINMKMISILKASAFILACLAPAVAHPRHVHSGARAVWL